MTSERDMMQALQRSMMIKRATSQRADNSDGSNDASRRDAAIQRAIGEGERRKEARRKRIEFEQETGVDLPHDPSLEKPT